MAASVLKAIVTISRFVCRRISVSR
jgi:hypothetical protein